MLWGKVLLILLGVFGVALIVRVLGHDRKYQRRFDGTHSRFRVRLRGRVQQTEPAVKPPGTLNAK